LTRLIDRLSAQPTRPQRTAKRPRRRLCVGFAAVAALLLLPLSASAFISTGPTADRSWYWQNPLPQGNALYGLSFPTPTTGWAVGTSGVVLKTADGGVSWSAQDCGTQTDLLGTAFPDTNNGWVTGLNGTIRHTADGGTTWTNQGLGTISYRAVAAYSATSAICVGDRGTTTSTIAYTKNAGSTWAYGTTASTVQLMGATMASSTVGWAVGASGTILKTTDGGVTWTALTSGTTVGLNAIAAARGTTIAYAVGNVNGSTAVVLKTVNGTTWTSLATGTSLTLNGVAVNSDGTQVTITAGNGSVYRSNNGGTTWSNQTPALLGTTALRGVQMPDATHVFTVGDWGTMLASSNSGVNWTSQMLGTISNLQATWFANPNLGWAVGASGTILRTADAGVTWSSRSVTTGTLRGLMFVDTSNGWAVGDAGAIFRTADGGATWTAQTSGTTNQLNGVWFKDASNGYAVGTGGTLRVTANGGATWATGTSGMNQTAINGIWFADANNGFLVGANGNIKRTTNGGSTWVTSTSGTTQTLYAVRGVSANTVWVVGNAGTLLKTTNGGTSTWTSLTSATGTTQPLYSVFFTDVNNGWIGGAYGTLRATTNGGSTWAAQNAGLPTNTSETNVPVRGLYFPTGNNGFLVGDAGALRKTVNTGATWTAPQFGTVQTLNRIQFTDVNTGWIIGNSGALLTTKDSGQSWAMQKSGSTSNMSDLSMVDSATGWMAGTAGAIRKTVDGRTWTAQTSNTSNILYGISSATSQTAITVGVAGTIRYTIDGGTTWQTPTTIPTAQNINDVSMISSTTAYAVATYASGFPNIIKTTNRGQTWAAVAGTPNPTSNFYSVSFLPSPNQATGFIAGDSGIILKTTDSGATWVRQTTPTSLQMRGVAFADSSNGWAVGTSGTVLRTKNGGSTWTVQLPGTASALYGVAFVDANHGWIVGAGGTILRTTNQSAPVTTLTTAPPAPTGTNGWYTSAPQITLTPSVTSTTYYSWTASTGPFAQYTAPFPAPEGQNTVYYYSIDPGGNQEAVRSSAFKGDYTSPTTPASASGGTPTTSTVPIYWTPSIDSVSGIARYDVYVGGVLSTSTASTSTTLTGLTPNTSYSIAITAVDNAGLPSLPMTPFTVTTLDLVRTPYATSISVVPAVPTGVDSWFVSSVPTISLTTTPTGGTIHYRWDSASETTYTGSFAALQGSHTLWYYASDSTGVRTTESEHQFSIKTDTSAPSTPTAVAVSTIGTSTATVSWSASADSASGVNRYEVLLNGTFAATTSSTSTALSQLSPNNTYSVTVVAVDNAGLASSASTGVAFTTVDVVRTPLSTQRTVTPTLPNGANGWYISAPTVALASTPSTVAATTYYSWISAAGAWSSYTSTLTAAEGNHTLYYSSHDNSGQRDNETTKSVTLNTDLTNPTQPASMSVGTPTTSTVAVSWSASLDSASGINHYDVMLDGTLYSEPTTAHATLTNLTPNTAYTITVIAVDTAGRTSLPSLPAFVQTPDLDRTPLVTTMSVTPAAPNGANSWYKTEPSITLSSAPSTVSATIYYSWTSNSGPWLVYSSALAPAQGSQTLYYYAHDNTGQRNNEVAKQATFKTDTATPATPNGLTASAVTTSAATITWTPSADTSSGIAFYRVYRNASFLNSVSTTTATMTGLSETTTYTVEIVAVNGAGSISATSTLLSFETLTIDRTPLATTLIADPAVPNGDNHWYITYPSVTLTHSPDVPANTSYSWESSVGPFGPYFGENLYPAEGTSTVWYHSIDPSGVRTDESVKSTSFRVDTINPLAPDTVSAGSPGTSTVSVSWSGAASGTSPIDHYSISVATSVTPDTVVATATAASTEATLTGLMPNAEYAISVTTVSESGLESEVSTPPVMITTLDIDRTPLTTSANFSAAPTGANDWYVTTPTVTLTSEPATVTPVTHQYKWDSASDWTTYTEPFQAIDGAHTLYYRSSALDHNEESTKATDVKLDPLVPAPASGLVTSTVTHDSVTLSWLPVSGTWSGIASYEIWDDYIGSTTNTFYTVGGLLPNHPYSFSIVTVNGAGTRSSSSTTVTIETSAAPLPTAPTAVLARAQGGESVFINWLPPTDTVGATSYNLWRSTDGVSYSLIGSTSGVTNDSYIDSGLNSLTRYWYAVQTVDSRPVPSSLSDTSTARWPCIAPTTTRPVRPAGLATVSGSNSVLLTWAPSTDASVTSYVVSRAPRSLATTGITTFDVGPPVATTWTDTTAVNGQYYWYSVSAVNGSAATTGWPSLEKKASPSQATTATDPHTVLPSGEGTSCPGCHSVHHAPATGSPVGWNVMWTVAGPNEDMMCLRCHSLGSGLASDDTSSQIGDPLKQSWMPVYTSADTTTTGKITCASCHAAIAKDGSPAAGLIAAGGQGMIHLGGVVGNAACYTCHGPATTLQFGDMSGFESSAHNSSAVPDPPGGSRVKCATCHEMVASRNQRLLRYDGYMVCMQCHTSTDSNPGRPDIWSNLTMGETSNSRHPLLPQDQTTGARMQCENCHNSMALTAQYPNVDPYNPSPSGKWTTDRADQKTFCFTCHDGGALPTSAETTAWANPILGQGGATTTVDIKSAYSTNFHGSGVTTDPVRTQSFLRPDMGYVAGTTLECRSCHDPHGTINAFALRQDVGSATGDKIINGVLVCNNTGTVGGYDLRFFCATCHLFDPATHDSIAGTSTVLFPTDCTQCHRHVQGGL